jgi:hypothetical protein
VRALGAHQQRAELVGVDAGALASAVRHAPIQPRAVRGMRHGPTQGSHTERARRRRLSPERRCTPRAPTFDDQQQQAP